MKASTIIRCVALVAVLINQALAIWGKELPFTGDEIYQTVSLILTVGVSFWSAWKNNDFTSFAILSGKILDLLRSGTLTKEEVEGLIEEKKQS